jgi:hypothetical protein
MTNNPDYRKYLEQKFDSFEEILIEKFKVVDVKLDTIHDQVTKTNSRVNHLEEFRIKGEEAIIKGDQAIKTRVTPEMLKQVEKEIIAMVDDQHLAKCPQATRIKSIEDVLTRRTAINMWVLRAIALLCTLTGAVYAVVHIINGLK